MDHIRGAVFSLPAEETGDLVKNFAADKGVTLVELMITIAVLSVIVAIAIPAYNGYIREGHFTTMRATLQGMRTPIEDFRLENGSYGANSNLSGVAAISSRFGWQPTGDTSAYAYTVSVTSTGSYDAWGTFGANIWVRCDTRFTNCCDSTTPGATAVTNACP